MTPIPKASAKTTGSQGECRTLALALRLAVHRLVTETAGEAPLLVLDDVLSELDNDRAAALLGHLPAGQVIITTAGTLPPAARPMLIPTLMPPGWYAARTALTAVVTVAHSSVVSAGLSASRSGTSRYGSTIKCPDVYGNAFSSTNTLTPRTMMCVSSSGSPD